MNKTHSGQTIFGLMIAISLGSFLLLLAVQFFQKIQWQQQQMWNQLELQLETEQALQVLGKELSRAGFRAAMTSHVLDNWSLFMPDQQVLKLEQNKQGKELNCAVFFYDSQQDGCLGKFDKKADCRKNEQNKTERVGEDLFVYRLHQQRLERKSYVGKNEDNCYAEQCKRLFSADACQAKGSGWIALIDTDRFNVNNLEFSLLSHNLVEIKLSITRREPPKITYSSSLVAFLPNKLEGRKHE